MKKKVSLLLASLLVTASFTGCGKNTASEPKPKTIKVGLNYELSGPAATYGQGLVNGIELAFEEINNKGGVLGKKLESVKADNKSENIEAANVAAKLATRDKVVAMLGPATSGNTKSAAPIAVQNKVPLISASATADDVTVDRNGKVREYVFKTCFSDSFQGVVMATFAYKDLGMKNVALLVDNTSDYSKGLAKNFKETYTKLGGNLVTEQAYQAKETDFKAVLTKIKGTKADVLFLPGYYEEVGLIVKQARELGITMPILGGDGYDSPKLSELAGKTALNDIYFTNHYSSKDTAPEVVKFQKAFKAKYNKDADAFNALGYDMVYLLADALKRSGEVDSIKLKDAIASTKDFNAITGKISIDKNHNPVKAISIIQMKNGQQTFLKKLSPQ
ncbi:ABC transporter substrate-binding protein [Clostridium tagluense]|uniref:ABC transporter substrate-binding protein n=1 Tax=Clostridium tagluense TaxID=360422 RepID=UPI001C0C76D5|nr:ABC transporter substrate-binding protein [Clostridium tagluense]MBU3128856.1 ABC transporter substrate-binding protein [Clostridium tagluense]MCB2310371.1 ABC transporter substrate-binding protein [Clostridium tagluense]MCB2314987.1 ABC transporter substrate-binding protein [Clostridium tagluense]MCB2320072.1 ABC transporter substrate-binding protein [Clostridium tagluense]MCB2324730.1 ABC transporter substrate-binding protein [Clostridium tagluense]